MSNATFSLDITELNSSKTDEGSPFVSGKAKLEKGTITFSATDSVAEELTANSNCQHIVAQGVTSINRRQLHLRIYQVEIVSTNTEDNSQQLANTITELESGNQLLLDEISVNQEKLAEVKSQLATINNKTTKKEMMEIITSALAVA